MPNFFPFFLLEASMISHVNAGTNPSMGIEPQEEFIAPIPLVVHVIDVDMRN